MMANADEELRACLECIGCYAHQIDAYFANLSEDLPKPQAEKIRQVLYELRGAVQQLGVTARPLKGK
jgi:hypothetical protein